MRDCLLNKIGLTFGLSDYYLYLCAIIQKINGNYNMKQKMNPSLFAQMAGMLTGARQTAIVLFVMILTSVSAWAQDIPSNTIEITSSNFNDYFEYNGDFEYPNATPNLNMKGGYFLKEAVPAESTLDFQGAFIPDASGTYNPRIFINKRVNITSSEKTAVFKPYTEDKDGEPVEKYWWTFGILEGADYTVVENLRFENCWVFNHGSSYVTFDGIDMKVQNVRIGRGQGGLTILTPDNGGHAVDHTTIKNSSFYCMNNGATSCIIAGHGAPYATFDHNTLTLEGNVGNGIYASIYNSNGSYPYPEFATFTNNVITGPASASMFCWCIVVCGQGNLVEGNTINYVGNAIYTASGSPSLDDTSAKNTYRNNTTTLGGSMSVHNYSVVEDNQVSGQLTLTKGATAAGNTVGKMTVSGQDVTAKNNTVNGNTTISGANATFHNNTVNGNTTISGANATFQNNTVNGDVTISKTTASFTDNAIYGTLTLNSASNSANDNNTITGNVILSTGDNAVVLNSSNNTVSGNILISANHEGNDAVKTTKTNTIEDNTLAAYEAATASSQSNAPFIITNETTTLKAGDGAGTFYYVPTGATVTINGTLTITPNEGATSPKVTILLGDGSGLNVEAISGSGCSPAKSFKFTYKRSFTEKVASTVCLPFNDYAPGSEGTYYTFTAIDKTTSPWTVTMTENTVTPLEANKPYLIMPAATGELSFTGTATSFEPSSIEVNDPVVDGGKWNLIGTYEYRCWNEYNNTNEIGSVYGFAAGPYSGDGHTINPGDFVKAASGADIPSFCAYLKYTAPVNSVTRNRRAADEEVLPSRLSVSLVNADGIATAIGTMDTNTGEVRFDSDAWYSIDGSRLNGKPAQKGVYINHGKIVIVK